MLPLDLGYCNCGLLLSVPWPKLGNCFWNLIDTQLIG
jgi:hypothetical protein